MTSSAQNANPLHRVLTVSQVTARIRECLEEVFQEVLVVGEVSNAKIYSSGHWYFSLKDKEATLPCICFKTSNSAIKFKLEDGLMVVASGKMTVYPPRGAYNMVVSSLEPVGIGDWQLAFEQLKSKLLEEGLLDPARKRTIPILPSRIGIVTSPHGAALRDILSALARRNRAVNVVIAPAKVQGEGSCEEIARAIHDLQLIEDLDVILVARGGGSIEDLWSFNTEMVARAVANSRIPVISGVGHETDVTICDLVADLRAPTPTAAAELVARGSVELLEKWTFLNRQLQHKMQERLSHARRLAERLNPLSSLLRYQDRLERCRMKVVHHKQKLLATVSRSLSHCHHMWSQNHHKLLALSPMSVLARGFSILREPQGPIISDCDETKPGALVEALLNKGKLLLRVESCQSRWSDDQTNKIEGTEG